MFSISVEEVNPPQHDGTTTMFHVKDCMFRYGA